MFQLQGAASRADFVSGVLLAALLGAAAPARAAAQAFEDPAPPVVAELEPIAAPEPVAPAGHRFHRAPKPLARDAVTEDWPCFLGSRRDGRSRETRLALDWPSGGPPLVWELARGQGTAAPVVAGERVVYTHREGNAVHVDCFQAGTGLRLWRFSTETSYRGRYFRDNGPRSTPVIDGGRVLVHVVDGELVCLELATGRPFWRRDLARELRIPDGFFGAVSSPLARDGRLLQILGAPGGPTVAAFDIASGRIVWSTASAWGADCASPVLATVRGKERLFAVTGGESEPPAGGLLVLDPESGALEHAYPFRSRTFASVNGASALVVGERVFLTASYNTGSAGLELDESGTWKELWRNRHLGIQFVNPIAIDGRVYVIDGVADRAGALVCVDPATGELLSRTDLTWDEELVVEGETKTRSGSVGEGSLLWADGRLLCLGDNGHLLWLEARPAGATVRARAALFRANQSWTPPVVSRGLLYICQNAPEHTGDAPPRLLCYDLRAGE